MNGINKSVLVIMFLVTASFVSLVLFSASGLRGWDQHWYAADVDTLLQGGPRTTNNVFPVNLMSEEIQTSPPFLHDILNLYLVLPAAFFFGSFKGWIVTNILATILTGWLIAFMVSKVANGWFAALAYTVYLLLPLTIWQSSQPLAEATIAPFVALGVLIYMKANKNDLMWCLLMIVTCAGYYSRSSFLLLLLVVPIAYLIQNRPVKTKNVLYTFAFLCFVFLVVKAKSIIFVSGVVPIAKLINSGVPGVTSNMYCFFSISPDPILLSNIYSKIVGNLTTQILSDNWLIQIFYLPFNIFTIAAVYFFFTKKSEVERRIAHCGIILLLLHMAIIVIHQNQFRYLLVTTPIVLVCSAVVINRIKFFQSKRVRLILLLAATFCLTISNIPSAIKLHHEGLQQKKVHTALVSMFDDAIAKDESLMVEYSSFLGYVLRPRTVIFIRPGYKHDDYQTMRERGNAKWLLCPRGSTIVEYFDISSSPVLKDFPHPYDNYRLFAL